MADVESWKRMVLRSMPPPAWLSSNAPDGDVVLSSRVRVMRNLRGFRFVHKASDGELKRIMDTVLRAAKHPQLNLEAFKGLTNAERDYLVGCRLVSPDFEWTLPGRALLVDAQRSLGVMVNEEDHIRLQALTAGFSLKQATEIAQQLLKTLSEEMEFAYTAELGYLSASPYNLGIGRRMSSMFHLIGLAQGKRLPAVIRALTEKGIVVRGLFGESSRAIGAFAQISVLSGTSDEFAGACDYLLREERSARQAVGTTKLQEKASQARDFLLASRSIGLADSLRVLAWTRWASSAGVPGFEVEPREIDAALTTLELRGTLKEEYAARQRVEHLRTALRL